MIPKIHWKTKRLMEEYITKHGEEFRDVIEDSILFVLTRQKVWRLRTPMNKRSFLEGLMRLAVMPKEDE